MPSKDFLGFPKKYRGDVKIYTPNNNVSGAVGLKIWQKPKGASLVYMTVVGGGAGGGGGFSRPAGNPGGGGGGGRGSPIVSFICPAIFLPDILYVQVGTGGAAAGAGADGFTGQSSQITFGPRSVANPTVLMISDASGGMSGGAKGTAATGGAGGGSGAAGSVSFTAMKFGFPVSTAVDTNGANGGAQTGANGGSITAWASGSNTLSSGAGGAGCTGSTNFSGGNITPTALLDIGSQGYFANAAGAIALGGVQGSADLNGGSGMMRITPFFNSGGAGGASNDSGQAGHGGSGGYGCGGGGGGAGTTGGRGGSGGPGIVIIVTV